MLLRSPDPEQLRPLQHKAVPVIATGETVEKTPHGKLLHESVQRLAALAGKIQEPGTDGCCQVFHIIASR